jgi:hypothetical protein
MKTRIILWQNISKPKVHKICMLYGPHKTQWETGGLWVRIRTYMPKASMFKICQSQSNFFKCNEVMPFIHLHTLHSCTFYLKSQLLAANAIISQQSDHLKYSDHMPLLCYCYWWKIKLQLLLDEDISSLSLFFFCYILKISLHSTAIHQRKW